MLETILFVLEGKKPEQLITNNLRKNSLLGNTVIEVVFEADIHQLYKILSNDEDIDVISYFIEKHKKSSIKNKNLTIQRNNIAQIYLFFDLDAHSNQYSAERLKQLLHFFNNETENGKLFISYPMVESIKYLENDMESFCRLTYKIDAGADYKEYIHAKTHKNDFSNFGLYDLNTWGQLVQYHCTKANFLVHHTIKFPEQSLEQVDIYCCQYEQYIQPKSSVLTISAFPLFLLYFYGVETLVKRLAIHRL